MVMAKKLLPPAFDDIIHHFTKILHQAGFKIKRPVVRDSSCYDIVLDPSGTVVWIYFKSQLNAAAVLMAQQIQTNAPNNPELLIATNRLTQGMLVRFREKGISVLDSDGNGYVRLPGYTYDHYVQPPRRRRPPSKGTPFSSKASRIVRALLSQPRKQWTPADLIPQIKITQGYASTELAKMRDSGYISISNHKIHLLDPEALLDDWAVFYRFDRHIQYRYAFNARSYEEGLAKIADALKSANIGFAFTGWSGAYLRAPYGIPQQWMAFISAIPEKPERFGLHPVQGGENAILIIPHDEGVFQFSRIINDLPVVSDPQLYIDLRKMPGRAFEQAQELRRKWSEGLKRE